jgi:hypothetical protein
MSIWGCATAPDVGPITVSSSAAVTLLNGNVDRVSCGVQNISTGTILLRLGGAASSSGYNYSLAAAGDKSFDKWQGTVTALASSSGCLVTTYEIAASTGG